MPQSQKQDTTNCNLSLYSFGEKECTDGSAEKQVLAPVTHIWLLDLHFGHPLCGMILIDSCLSQ